MGNHIWLCDICLIHCHLSVNNDSLGDCITSGVKTFAYIYAYIPYFTKQRVVYIITDPYTLAVYWISDHLVLRHGTSTLLGHTEYLGTVTKFQSIRLFNIPKSFYIRFLLISLLYSSSSSGPLLNNLNTIFSESLPDHSFPQTILGHLIYPSIALFFFCPL